MSAPNEDPGFTLVELLVVIVVLGVLAAVVVFAVGGITDRGETAAAAADERTVVGALESYRALHGQYASEAELVSAGFLREESDLTDIDLGPDLASYAIGTAGSFPDPDPPDTTAPETTAPTTTAPPAPQTVSFPVGSGSFGADLLDQGGTRTLAVIGTSGATGSLWTMLTTTPPADTDVVWFNQGDVDTTAEVDAILAVADYVIAPTSYPLNGGSTYLGVYLSDSLLSHPGDFWWSFQAGRNPTLAEVEAGLS